MPSPETCDDGADNASWLARTAGGSSPDSLIIALLVLLMALVGGYFLIGLDRMDAAPLTAAVEAASPPT